MSGLPKFILMIMNCDERQYPYINQLNLQPNIVPYLQKFKNQSLSIVSYCLKLYTNIELFTFISFIDIVNNKTLSFTRIFCSLIPIPSQIIMSQVTSLTSNESVGYRPPSKRLPSFLFPDIEDLHTESHILKQSVISNYEHSQYSIMCKASYAQLIFFQALAIFIFVFGCSSMKDPQQFQIHALYAVFLLFAICISGSLTGANINPSITLSNYLRKENKYTFKMIPIYFAGQFAGVIVALIAAKYINEVTFSPIVPEDTDWTEVLRQFANEMMGTILMVFFILQITNPNTTFIQNQMSGFLSIVLFFYLAIVLSPNTSSFALNFAIILATNLCSSLFQGNHDGWQWIWVYLVGEIVGVLVATFLYDQLFEPIIKKLREIRRQSLSFSTDFTEVEDD